jgi:methylglutaconyl-CoA hydratase
MINMMGEVMADEFTRPAQQSRSEGTTMATQECTLYEVREGAAWITLNRPQARNALSAQLVTEVYEHLTVANADVSVRVIVITGAGKGFCAGADLKNPPGQAPRGERAIAFPDVMTAIRESVKPVIAAVNGAAFAGGLGLVGAADIVICADEAIFSFSEVRIGVIPAVISVVCLPKLGLHHGTRLLLTGERFDGPAAVGYGLAHRSVPLADLAGAVNDEIATLNLAGPIALQECKKLIHAIPSGSLSEAFAFTQQWSLRMFGSEEGQEGMAAFREKRSPKWVPPQ